MTPPEGGADPLQTQLPGSRRSAADTMHATKSRSTAPSRAKIQTVRRWTQHVANLERRLSVSALRHLLNRADVNGPEECSSRHSSAWLFM